MGDMEAVEIVWLAMSGAAVLGFVVMLVVAEVGARRRDRRK